MKPCVPWLTCCALLAVALGCGGTQAVPTHGVPISADTDAATLHRFADALATQGDLVRAEQYALLSIARGMSPRVVLPLLLSVCLRASRVSAALAHAQPVLRAEPHDYRLRYVVASLYVALGRGNDAMRELLEVLRAAPEHDKAALLLAQLEGSTL